MDLLTSASSNEVNRMEDGTAREQSFKILAHSFDAARQGCNQRVANSPGNRSRQ